MKTQSTAGGGRVLAPSSRPVPRLVSRFASRSVLLACLVGPRCLIVSSSHPFVSSAPLGSSCLLSARPLASHHWFIGSAHRLAPPCLVSPCSPHHRQGRRGDTGFLIGGWREPVAYLRGGRRAGGCLLGAVGGVSSALRAGRHRVSPVVVVACLPLMGAAERRGRGLLASGRRAGRGRVSSVVVAVFLGMMDGGGRLLGLVPSLRVVAACLSLGGGRGRLGRFLFLLSAHPIDKASATARLIPSAHHLIDGDVPLVSFFFILPLTPSRRLFSACLLWLVPPSPAGGCAGRGMACGGGRGPCSPVCYRVRVVSLRSRSFARCYMPRLVALRRPIWGIAGRFTGYSARLPVGVGVFQYMPLNRILWLLTGIFGDGVRCPFSALPVAPSSSLRPASCPLPAAASWRS